MKTKEEILKPYEEIAQIQGLDFSVIIYNNVLSAMDEYVKEYEKEIERLNNELMQRGI